MDDRTQQARQHLDEMDSALTTLRKLLHDIEPSLCVDTDLARLQIAGAHLDEAEDVLADLCADNNERQEDEDSKFPFEAWDMIVQQPVTVLGWHPRLSGFYEIEPGFYSLAHNITTAFPSWYARAKQAQADAADERDTVEDVRYG